MFNNSVELFSLALRNSIPKLRLSPVAIIYWRKHEIFKMPTKGWIFHSYVYPWNIYSRHIIYTFKLKQWILLVLKIAKIPLIIYIIFLFRLNNFLVFCSKSTSILICIQISRIFDLKIWPNLIFNIIPIFFFNFFIYFLIITPIKKSILSFIVISNALKLSKGMALKILFKRDALRKLL